MEENTYGMVTVCLVFRSAAREDIWACRAVKVGDVVDGAVLFVMYGGGGGSGHLASVILL